jgi:hypothetical protein
VIVIGAGHNGLVAATVAGTHPDGDITGAAGYVAARELLDQTERAARGGVLSRGRALVG